MLLPLLGRINNLINNSLTHDFINHQSGNITLAISEAKHSETNNIFIEYHDDGTRFGGSIRCEAGCGDEEYEDEKVGSHFYLSLPKSE